MADHGQPAFGATATASLSGYEDVAPTDWYYEELAKAVQMGTFQGDNGALRPNQPITREQAFAVLARAFVLEAEDTDALNTLPDKGESPPGPQTRWPPWWRTATSPAPMASSTPSPRSPGRSLPGHQQSGRHLCGPERPRGRMVAGNVIVRGDAVSLDHLTVHGDLILADGAANVSLDTSV